MSTDRLDRIEAILERSIATHEREMAEMRAKTNANYESNLREMAEMRATMNANHENNLREMAEMRSTHKSEMAEMRAELNSTMNRLGQRVDNLSQTVSALVQVVEVHQRNFDAIIAEMRGIRTENQRILEHLFGAQGNQT